MSDHDMGRLKAYARRWWDRLERHHAPLVDDWNAREARLRRIEGHPTGMMVGLMFEGLEESEKLQVCIWAAAHHRQTYPRAY